MFVKSSGLRDCHVASLLAKTVVGFLFSSHPRSGSRARKEKSLRGNEKLSQNCHCERSVAISFMESLGKTIKDRAYFSHCFGFGIASSNHTKVVSL